MAVKEAASIKKVNFGISKTLCEIGLKIKIIGKGKSAGQISNNLFPLNFCKAAHVWTQNFRNCDTAIFVLVIFDDGDEHAADCAGGAV